MRAATWPPKHQVQQYARITVILMLLSVVGGGFGEAYAPSHIIVSGDATVTAHNVTTSPFFRLGFAAYLVEAVCDVGLALMFYVLLRPAGRTLALFSAFLGLVSTAVFAGGEAFYFAPSLILSNADYLKGFSPDQLNALALLSLKFYGKVGGIFLGFYGLTSLVRGWLMFRSGYLPRVLGALFMLGGAGFVMQNIAFVLAPGLVSDLWLMPLAVGGISLMLWLLVKGVDVPKWEAAAVAVESA